MGLQKCSPLDLYHWQRMCLCVRETKCMCAFVTMVFFECVRVACIDYAHMYTSICIRVFVYTQNAQCALKSYLGVFTYTQILKQHAVLIAAKLSIFWIPLPLCIPFRFCFFLFLFLFMFLSSWFHNKFMADNATQIHISSNGFGRGVVC